MSGKYRVLRLCTTNLERQSPARLGKAASCIPRLSEISELPYKKRLVYHGQSTLTKPPHPKMRPFLPVLPYRTRHLGTTASPLRHMTEIRPTIILPRKQAAWARSPPKILEKISSDRWRYPRVSGLGGSFQERSERKERG